MRRPRLILVALALALGLGASPLASTPALAEGLELVGHARYDLLPDEGRIRVTVDFRATNTTPDTGEVRTVYTGVSLVIHSGAASIRAAAGPTPLVVGVVEADDRVTAIEVEFDHSVEFEERYDFRLSYDLFDPGGTAGRDLRIGRTLVAFPVWAFGSGGTPGSVTVAVPAGYTARVEYGQLEARSLPEGGQLLTALVADPLTFIAYVTAERPGAFTETRVDSPVCRIEACIRVRAWEDDPDWGVATTQLVAEALPVLEELIGLEYPIAGPLTVEEAASGRLGDYAGIFDTFDDTVRIRYDADPFVALHELAHAWFNGKLYEERWIGEAFASYYAEQAAPRLGLSVEAFILTEELMAARIPLNDWGEIGVEDLAVEDYAYAATYELGRLIADRAGLDGLQVVWRASSTRELAYQPIHPGGDSRPDVVLAQTQRGWQRLLDLLEERTEREYADLWAEWVMNAEELRLLDDRELARNEYRTTLRRADDWELPRIIRFQLSSWRFTDAVRMLDEAERLLGQRDTIAGLARVLALTPPGELRSLFEAGEIDDAERRAEAEIAALQAIRTARHRLDLEVQPLEAIGLLGTDPGAHLAAAMGAYQEGEVDRAQQAAAAALAARDGADDAGRSRVLVGSGTLLALDGLVLVALGIRRQRRPLAA